MTNLNNFTATFPFLTAGLLFGYLFFLPWIDNELYNTVSFWPYFAMLFSIVITASMLTIIKLNNGKYIFEHFTFLIVASILYIITGTLFATLPDSCEFSSKKNISKRRRKLSDSCRVFIKQSVTSQALSVFFYH